MADLNIPTSFFKANRDKLFEDLKADYLILTASSLLQKTGDQAFPFKQDTNFWYLTGLNEPDLILFKSKNEEFLIAQEQYLASIDFAEKIDNQYLAKRSGIKEILNHQKGWQKISSLVKDKDNMATLTPSPPRLKVYSMYANPARRQLYLMLKRKFPNVQITDAKIALARMRMIKQPIEISLIQKATDITTSTLNEVLAADNLRNYRNTYEIDLDIQRGFKKRGGQGHGFEPIIALGKNAATIHYEKFEKLRPNELLVCDVGCEYSFYDSDITRTVSYGQPTLRQRAVYAAVYAVQQEVFKMIKPGLDFKEYEKTVEGLIGLKLKELKVISKLNPKEIRKFYPHACSHSLGLDAHDSADYSLKMQENMVIAVEPGIYIKDEAIAVRIEDVVLITKTGAKVLSQHLPTSLSF